MFFDFFKKYKFLSIYFILHSFQCIAEEIDYINTYLPKESYIHQRYNEVKNYSWFRRLFNQQTLNSCKKINAAFKNIHDAARLVQADHENALHVVQQQMATYMNDITESATPIMYEFRDMCVGRYTYEQPSRYISDYDLKELPDEGKKLVKAMAIGLKIADNINAAYKGQQRMKQKAAIEAIYLDIAMRNLWKKATEKDLIVHKNMELVFSSNFA